MMSKHEWTRALGLLTGFLAVFYLPVGAFRFDNAVTEALQLARWYAREHVLLCLVPAFFIAGAISVFINQASVLKYLGARAHPALAYGVASVSGTVLAVCSCTVLPLFAGIYKRGAGLGPATAFLYAGPAINVLAIILTARVLGLELGVARAVGAMVFSIVIGLVMSAIFKQDESARLGDMPVVPETGTLRSLLQETVFFGTMVAMLVFANWAESSTPFGAWNWIYANKWPLTSVFGVVFATVLVRWFHLPTLAVAGVVGAVFLAAVSMSASPLVPFAIGALGLAIITSRATGDAGEWFQSTWAYTTQITPLLIGGVLVAGFMFGRPGHEGVIPSAWIAWAVGGNGVAANLFASVAGAFMYFATLTEVPVVQGLLGSGMGKGPALALLLAGPALSLPSMLVLQTVLGTRKTLVYVALVVIMATVTGLAYGACFRECSILP